MLPHADNLPPIRSKLAPHSAVSLDVAFDLVRPIRDSAYWHPQVATTPMPKAAVDEDGEASPSEDHVRSPWNRGDVPRETGQPSIPQLTDESRF